MGALVFTILLLLVQLGLLAAVLFFLYNALVWVISGHLDAPFVPTPVRYAELVAAALELSPEDVVYELGCGEGKFMLALAALEPRATFVGVERNPFLYAAALVRKKLAGNSGNVEFRRGNFFEADLSQANKAYAYLLSSVMYQLRPKFEKEFKGRLASRAFPFSRPPAPSGKELSNVVMLTERIGAHGQHLLFVYDF